MAKIKHNLTGSELIEGMPVVCSSEKAALAFFEKQRWGDSPCCVWCGSTNVYTIKDRKTGERRKDGRWRCREKECGRQYTVRVGQIMEDSPIALHKWAYAFWSAATSKNGVSAMELMRKVQVSYKSALYMMNRIRWAMAPAGPEPKLDGTVEMDETYIGGKVQRKTRSRQRQWGRGTDKAKVVAVVKRGGPVRASVTADVSGKTMKAILERHVEKGSDIMTDSFRSYVFCAPDHGTHGVVRHGIGEYVRWDDANIHTNNIEGYFSRVKRCLNGTWHAVSKEHLHRYVCHTAYLFNTRKMNDGERVENLVRSADGKRLPYKALKAG